MHKDFTHTHLYAHLCLILFGIFFSVVNLIFPAGIYGQEATTVSLEIRNSFAVDANFQTGTMVWQDNKRYTTNFVVFDLYSNSGSQYQITGDLQSSVSGSGVGEYSIQRTVNLSGNDGDKTVFVQFFRVWSGGYYVEKIDKGPFNFVLDNSPPSQVSLLTPLDQSELDGIVHFQWSQAVDTGVGFLEYTYSFSQDPAFGVIDYAGTTSDEGVIFNVNDELGTGDYYWMVTAEDKLGNTINSQVFQFSVGEVENESEAETGGGYVSTRLVPYTLAFDDCPDGDYTLSYYDGRCGQKMDVVDEVHYAYSPDDELYRAYEYAFKYGITTMYPYENADMTGKMLRMHLAKMMSQFAINVMGVEPNVNTGCVFSDIDDISEEFQYFTVVSCQLGMMGLDHNGYPKGSFEPRDFVTREQFATVLSRLLFNGAFNGNAVDPHIDHMRALNRANIMNYINLPKMIELRGFVMLMLMRSDEYGFVDIREQSEIFGIMDN